MYYTSPPLHPTTTQTPVSTPLLRIGRNERGQHPWKRYL